MRGKMKMATGLSKELLMGSVSVNKQRAIHAALFWSHVIAMDTLGPVRPLAIKPLYEHH